MSNRVQGLEAVKKRPAKRDPKKRSVKKEPKKPSSRQNRLRKEPITENSLDIFLTCFRASFKILGNSMAEEILASESEKVHQIILKYRGLAVLIAPILLLVALKISQNLDNIAESEEADIYRMFIFSFAIFYLIRKKLNQE